MQMSFISRKGFTPSRIFKYFLLAAIFLSFLMALASNYDRHPDEANHLSAAFYYIDHFLPPEIGDPAVRESYSVWGISYLNYHWVEYFLAGKFTFLISPIVRDPIVAARFFNVFLFALLAALFLYRSKEDHSEFIIPCFLLVTPQIWYVFSYSNNDAFAFFVSLLLVYQLGYPKSFLHEYLNSGSFSSKAIGGIFAGILGGLLLICKPNYWVVVIFAALWLLISSPLNTLALKKYTFTALIALTVFSFRIGLDLHVNGETHFSGFSYINYFLGGFETKQSKLLAYQEEIASYELKPSTLANDLANSRTEVKLRAKGTTAAEMFSKWRWHKMSFDSFAGGYAYMSLWGPIWYYRAMFLLFSAFGLYLAVRIFASKDRSALRQLAVVVFGSLLTLFISFYLSWNYAFQPQGRYLFPAIAMVALLVYSNRELFHNFVVNAFLFAAFCLSVYSFVFVALASINIK